MKKTPITLMDGTSSFIIEAEEGMILHEIRSGWETKSTYLEYRWDEELQKDVLRVPEDFEERKHFR
jgi:hypothetical protein